MAVKCTLLQQRSRNQCSGNGDMGVLKVCPRKLANYIIFRYTEN